MTVSLLMRHLILWGTKTILGVFSEIEAFPFLPFLNTSYCIYAPCNNSIFSIAVFAKQRRSVRYFFYPSTKFLCRPREFFLYWTFAWFLLFCNILNHELHRHHLWNGLTGSCWNDILKIVRYQILGWWILVSLLGWFPHAKRVKAKPGTGPENKISWDSYMTVMAVLADVFLKDLSSI